MSDARTRLAWRDFTSDPTAEKAHRWAILEARGRESLPQPDAVLRSPIRDFEKVWNGFSHGACGRLVRALANMVRSSRGHTTHSTTPSPERELPDIHSWPEVGWDPTVGQTTFEARGFLVSHLVKAGPTRFQFVHGCGDETILAGAAGLEAIGVHDADWTALLVAASGEKRLREAYIRMAKRPTSNALALVAAKMAEVRAEQATLNFPLDGDGPTV